MANKLTILKELVIAEATNLKKYATREELSKLDFDRLDPIYLNKCVYGQMTGSCFSDRAIKLIEKSCNKVYTRDSSDMNRIKGILNGNPNDKHRNYWWSPIEVFIDRKINRKINNEAIIAFLRDETDTLTLK